MMQFIRRDHTFARGLSRHGEAKAGFTLIELLVVIAIIGILSSVVLASLNSARQKGRDAKRISDVKQLQLALELYYDANSKYPTAISGTELTAPGYIAVIPKDPTGNTNYSYTPYQVTGATGICSSYHLGASLEVSTNSVLSSDSDVVAVPSGYQICTGGPAADFSGADALPAGAPSPAVRCATGDAGVACFDVKS